MDQVVVLNSTSSPSTGKLRGQTDQPPELQLSVVATSRNDDHGGNLLHRMQHFVDGFVAQCRRHNVSAELILVEWNPPADRPSLAEALRWPEDTGPCEIRIITVPPAIHGRLGHADRLPLFQMIAKNVGIRRARGRFVLATNIDIVFSDAIIRFMRDRLKPGRVYRADRYDVPTGVPQGVPFDDLLAFCEREAFRVNRRDGNYIRRNSDWVRLPPRNPPLLVRGKTLVRMWWRQELIPLIRRFGRLVRREPRVMLIELMTGLRRTWQMAIQASTGIPRSTRRLARAIVRRWEPSAVRLRVKLALFKLFRLRLHTNACGDFTLLSRNDWFELRCYPEWEIFSWHLDSVFIYQADRSGVREVKLDAYMQIYHIEHSTGSGYTPEGMDELFSRIRAKGIPYLTWEDFLRIVGDMDQQKNAAKQVVYNTDDWGLAGVALPEVTVVPKVGAEAAAGTRS